MQRAHKRDARNMPGVSPQDAYGVGSWYEAKPYAKAASLDQVAEGLVEEDFNEEDAEEAEDGDVTTHGVVKGYD